MTNQFVNSINSNILLDCAVNGTVEELTAFLQVYCAEIGYEQITSLDYELMSNAIFYYIHEAGITLNNNNSSEYLNASQMLLTTANLTSFADDMSGYLMKVIDLAGQAGNEFASKISDAAEAIEKGKEIFDTISNASTGNRKEIIGGLVSNAAGTAAGAFIPAIMSSGIPTPAKVILGFGFLMVGDAVSKGIDEGYIELPISDTPHFPKDLDDRFKDILDKNGLDKDGVIIDAMNAYNNFMKNKDKNKGPSTDKAETMISPIIIDLDNDGIETVSVNDGVYFDHDNNSYIERTAWVGKDDALLVRDVNGNGTIDSGRELFGNNTQLSDGTFAKNGYEALQQLDENNDGIIDSKDSIWNELYLWKDNNKNGYTDPGELITLSDASVAAIKYTYQDSQYIDQNGNKHKQTSEVIMDNGEHTVSADVWFNTNNQNTYHIPTIDIRDDIRRLPNISGMGNVTSLHEAMNNDEELTKLVKDFIADPKSHTQDNLIEQIVYKWVGVEGSNETMQLVSFINNTTGTTFRQYGSPIPGPAACTELKHELEKFEKYTAAQLLRQTEFALEFSTIELSYDSETNQLYLDTTLFESLIKSMEKSDLPRSLLIRKIFSDLLVYNPELIDMSNTLGITELKVADENHTNLVFRSNEAGNATSYYLKSGFNSVTLEDIESKSTNTSTIYLNDFASTNAAYTKLNNNLIITLSNNEKITLTDYFTTQNYRRYNIHFNDKVVLQNDIESMHLNIYGTEAADSLSGWDNNELLYGYGGNDSLYGRTGNDLLDGGDGDDTLYGDVGQDTLNGGAGNDSLSGGDGTDTYIFTADHGHDTVTDRASSAINRLVFEGAQSTQLLMKKDGYNLVIQAYGTDDAVTVKDFFYDTDNSRFELVFDDRTMSMEELHAAGFLVYGTDSANTLSGWNNNDTLYGYAGNDSLYGKTGDDLLDGGDGDDRLDGDAGQDILNGGAGNDTLNGGNDSDTYIFHAGHGHDTVTDKTTSAISKLVFEGAQSGQLMMKKDGNNLVIQAYGTDDAVTVKDFFYSADYSRFELVFDDRTMTMEELHAAGFPVYGTDAANSLSGWNNNDTLYGYAGSDSLYGKTGDDLLDGGDGDDRLDGDAGQDILNGGAGNDTLNGGNDSDTYIFHAGHGHDTVTDKTTSAISKLVFEGAQSGQLLMKKDGNNLVIQAYGTDDAVTVKDFFYSADYSRFELVFDDRTMTMEELHAAGFLVYGTDSANTLSGWNNNDTLYGYAGNDSLYGKTGDDLLDGGDGDDRLDGDAGQDILNGGAGNDTLNGGNDSDTYIFHAGHGHDTVTDKTTSAISKLVFEGAQSGQLLMKKDGNNLVIQAYGTDDAVTVKDFFYSADYSRFELVFDDRTMTMEELHAAGFPVYGTDAANSLSGWNNNDTLYGYAGNDSLYGKTGDDLLDGGDGDDRLDGDAGQDTLTGGAGNDTLNGGNDSDTYIFHAGHGHDTVTDKTTSAISKLVFEGAQSGQLLMKKDGNNLVIQAYGTDDAVTVKDFFYSADYSRFELVFDDHTMTMEELHAAGFPVYGTDAANSLSGWNNNDTLYGYAGNDSLYGKTGDDLLDGGDGDDRLDGDAGQDTLTGGAGNDTLNGGNDSDTYIFHAGHGHDTVTDKTTSAISKLVFEGAQSGQLLMKKDGNNLVIQAYGTDDAVTVKDFFYSADYSRFELVFDDHTMTMEELHAAGFPVYGTDAANSLSGWNNNDTLYGYAGNDSLYGKTGDDLLDGGDGDDRLDGDAGQDTLTGGAGNDTLNGGNDSDTYIFHAGHGHDTVTDKTTSAISKLVFEGAQSGQLLMKKDGNNLVIQAYGTDDAVTVKDFFYSADYSRFELVFDDHTMTMEELHAAGFPVYGTDAANSLSGWNNNDTLYGYAGNDSLYGYDGNDILDGGAGNDTLIGGGGSDVYKFYDGHGQDTLNDGASTSINKLVFEGAYSNYVSMEKKGYDLIINAYLNEDSITIEDYFYSESKRRLELHFEDNTITMEELPEFVTDTLAKNDLLLTKQPESMSGEILLSTRSTDAVQTMTASSETAQLHQLINAMAAFGNTEGGSGMTGNVQQVEDNYNHLTIPQ